MDSKSRHILDLSRRGLLRGATAAGALAALQPAFSRAVIAQPVFRADPFTQGVASGDPLPDGAVIWTRLAPDPLAGGGGTAQQAAAREVEDVAALAVHGFGSGARVRPCHGGGVFG